MLRIAVNETNAEQRWVLQGRLAGPNVAELDSSWAMTQSSRQGRKCVVDLSEVTFIDESGEEALRAMMKEGARFIACGVCVKHILENLDRAMRSRHRQVANRDCFEWGKENSNGR